VYLWWFPPPPSSAVVLPPIEQEAAGAADAAAQPVPAFEVVETAGTVEAIGGVAPRALARGARLFAGESIRTGDDGGAVLRGPSGDELALRERVTLEVTSLSRTLTELTLTRGKLRAAAAPATERFAVSAGSARAVAPGGSRFTIYADARGAAYVASESGPVQVAAGGGEVVLESRRQTVIEPGAPPRDPFPVPDEVFVSVDWPEREQRGARAMVRGVTEPGTTVMVNGVPTPVAADGSFAAPVTLREGRNPIEVRAEDVAGRERTLRDAVNARTAGPPLEADPSRLYDDP
jgi:hypothetical protein